MNSRANAVVASAQLSPSVVCVLFKHAHQLFVQVSGSLCALITAAAVVSAAAAADGEKLALNNRIVCVAVCA